MSVRSDKSDYARRPVCTLKEFVECFPYPQVTRLAQDHRVDIVGNQPLILRRGTTVTIRNKAPVSVSLTCADPYSLTLDRQKTFTMRADVKHRFRLLPYDPSTGDQSPMHMYPTVQELVRVWPPEAIVGEAVYSSGSASDAPLLAAGDRIRLTRRIWFNNESFLECRRLPHPGVCLLPMDVTGKFTAVLTERLFTLGELLAMPSRRRRLQLTPNMMGKLPQLAGLPEGFSDDLYLEELSVCAECSTPALQGLNFELHAHIRVYLPHSASLDGTDSASRGHPLRMFCESNRYIFPLVVQVTDWDEETNVLENAGVRPGSTLVFHEIQDAEKVLCTTDTSPQHYALPLTYPGIFTRQVRLYNSVAHVTSAKTLDKLRVTDVHPGLSKCPVKVGDIVQLRDTSTSDSIKHRRSGSVKEPGTTKFYKYDAKKPNAKPKDIRLPSEAPIRFEEVRVSQSSDASQTGEKLTDFIPLFSREVIVLELEESRLENKFKDRDLPVKTPITLVDKVKESGVVVSWEQAVGGSTSSSASTSTAPRFVIPLRTNIYVKFVSQTDEGGRGRQQQQQQGQQRRSDVVASSVHCPELLTLATYTDLRQRRGDLILPPEREALTESISESIRQHITRVDSVRQQRASPLLQQAHLSTSMRSLSTRSLNSPLTNGHSLVGNGTLVSRNGSTRLVKLVPMQTLSRTQSLSSPLTHAHVTAVNARNTDTRSMASLRVDDDDRASVVTYRNFPQVKLILPKDGNLIGFSAMQMAELLRSLRIDDAVVDNLLRRRLDGERFSKLTSNDLRALNLLHPVLIYFRRLTRKKVYL